MLCVAVGGILPLLSPGINSTFPPSSSRSPSARQASPRICSWRGHSYCCPSPRVAHPSLLSKTELQKAPNTFFCYIFMKSARPSCCYTSLPSLYYLYQSSSVTHWTLVHSSLLWNNLLEPFYFSEFLYIIQKQQSLAGPKVSQSAFQTPSNLPWIVLSLFYRCK